MCLYIFFCSCIQDVRCVVIMKTFLHTPTPHLLYCFCVTVSCSKVSVHHTVHPDVIVYCSWEGDAEVALRSETEGKKTTKKSRIKWDSTLSQEHTHQNEWWIIPVLSRAQMQIYPNSGGTQAAAVWASCQFSEGRHSVPGTGEVTLFSYSARLIGMGKKKKKCFKWRCMWSVKIGNKTSKNISWHAVWILESRAAVAGAREKRGETLEALVAVQLARKVITSCCSYL